MQVSISDTNIQGKGLYKDTVYTLQVMPGKFVVGRRFDDFVRLRKQIVAKNMPGITVPQLPKARFFGKFNPAVIENRKQEFQKFLNFLTSHSVFYDETIKLWLGLVVGSTSPTQFVLEKLLTVAPKETQLTFLEAKAKSLHDKDAMKSMYLDFDWETTKRIYFETTQTLAPMDSTASYEPVIKSGSSSIIPPLSTGAEPVVADRGTLSSSDDVASSNINPALALFVSPAASVSGIENVTVQSQIVSARSTAEDSSGIVSRPPADEPAAIEDEIPTLAEEECVFLSNYNPTLEKNRKQKLRIKLVITEIASKNTTKTLRRLLCPIVDTIGPYFDKTLPKFGMFHTALIIGPWYIEWNASSLCIPRKIMSRAAFLSCDIDGIIVEKERIEDVRENLSRVICHWNSTKRYNNNPSDKTREGNCQDFVDDVLAHLGVDASSIGKGVLGDFFNEMRTKGVCEMSFKISPEIRQEYGIKESSMTFNTHLELDKFVSSLLEKDRDFGRKYDQEWSLLKSFDRAFWLRHLKEPDNPTYLPMQLPDKDTGCPFDNPVSTTSFAMDRL